LLDVPALALSLSAVVLFLRAGDADSIAGAVAAGVVAGIATQTKYTAFLAPVVMALYAASNGKWRLAVPAVLIPFALFAGWEWAIARRYGVSHFWLGYLISRAPVSTKLNLVQPLYGYLGSTMAMGFSAGPRRAGIFGAPRMGMYGTGPPRLRVRRVPARGRAGFSCKIRCTSPPRRTSPACYSA